MFDSVTPVARAIIIANAALFLGQNVAGDTLILWFALWPIGSPLPGGYPGFEPWQLLTYSFLHGGIGHLFFNMFALYMFGSELERLWGAKLFMNLYFASVLTAALAQLAFAYFSGSLPYPTIGASGGVFGLLLAYAMYFPRRRILLLIPPIPLPAWLFVTLYGLLELYLGVTGTQQGVAHFAHLGGMLGAWLTIQYRRGRAPFARRPRKN